MDVLKFFTVQLCPWDMHLTWSRVHGFGPGFYTFPFNSILPHLQLQSVCLIQKLVKEATKYFTFQRDFIVIFKM